MFAVIFEVEPRQGKTEEYLQLAASLRPELEKINGFLEIERFASERAAGRLLSLSIWRDEAALTRWRNLGMHRHAQQKGRSEVFADYRLRVGEIVAAGGGETVTLSEFSATESASAEFVLPVAGAPDVSGSEVFASLYNPGKRLVLVSWQDHVKAALWRPQSIASGDGLHHRRVRVIRDYGMFDRAHAPQYYPPVPKTA
jgi:heme-degrading monooxygenase HmoA